MALLALAVAVAPLPLCDCTAMNARPASDAHCGNPQPNRPSLASGCDCACVSAAPEAAAVFPQGASLSPAVAAQAPAAVALGQRHGAAPARAIGREHSPPALTPFVLRI
jgi:hypothetical protein